MRRLVSLRVERTRSRLYKDSTSVMNKTKLKKKYWRNNCLIRSTVSIQLPIPSVPPRAPTFTLSHRRQTSTPASTTKVSRWPRSLSPSPMSRMGWTAPKLNSDWPVLNSWTSSISRMLIRLHSNLHWNSNLKLQHQVKRILNRLRQRPQPNSQIILRSAVVAELSIQKIPQAIIMTSNIHTATRRALV